MNDQAAKLNWNPDRLDVMAMARANGEMASEDRLSRYGRLTDDAMGVDGESPDGVIRWTASAQLRAGAGGQEVPWLHLLVQADVPVCCQRCLQPVAVPLNVDRWFRFVADEAAAESQDDESEEDVLALEPRPSLRDLIEDELLMEIPLVPMHDECPNPLPAAETGPDEVLPPAEPPHPFAALASLKR